MNNSNNNNNNNKNYIYNASTDERNYITTEIVILAANDAVHTLHCDVKNKTQTLLTKAGSDLSNFAAGVTNSW